MRSEGCTSDPKSARALRKTIFARMTWRVRRSVDSFPCSATNSHRWVHSLLPQMIIWACLLVVLWGHGSVVGAQILFQEEFEDGNLASRGWYDIVRWGTEFFISTAERRSQNASLEVRYQSGSTGPYMRHQFPGQDRVYSRYYRKWASNWLWPGSFGPHDTYLFGMYGQQYFAPTTTYLTIYTDSIYAGPPDWQFGTVGLQTKAELQGRGTQSPSSLMPPPPRFELNRWYCIETLATMNTPGNSDGRLQLWLDGVAIFDLTGVLLRDSNNASLQFDTFMFGPYFHDGTSQIQSTWIDALVIATERVGCLESSDTMAPAAPTNVRIN